MKEPEETYTLEEAAAATKGRLGEKGISVPMLRLDVREGNVTFYQTKLGAPIFITATDLGDYIQWKKGKKHEAMRRPSKRNGKQHIMIAR